MHVTRISMTGAERKTIQRDTIAKDEAEEREEKKTMNERNGCESRVKDACE